MNGNNLNSNKMEISDKVNHRTHHTRFFEKLYGNLEKSSDEKKDEVTIINHHDALSVQTEIGRREALTSPSNSSGSSTENYPNEVEGSRCEEEEVIRVFRAN
jgi:hypothetical protein